MSQSDKSTLSVHRLYSKWPHLAWTHARCLPRHCMVNSLVTNRLFMAAQDIDEPPFQFIYTVDFSVVDMMLHDSPDLIIHRTEIWLSGGYRLDVSKFGVSWCSSSTVAPARRSVPVHCPAGTKSLSDTVYHWELYDVIMTSWSSIKAVSKRYHQNFLLCNNNEITACIADLFNSFCEEVYVVAFFKVVQQQIIGKVEDSITFCGQIISVCNSEKNIKIGQYLQKLCSNEKGSCFFDSQCIMTGPSKPGGFFSNRSLLVWWLLTLIHSNI